MHENREISRRPWSDKSRPVREGHKPNGGHARAGEVGLCRSTCEAAEQGRETLCGGWGGKGTGRGEHRSIPHAPTQSGNYMSQEMGGVRQAVLPPLIHGKSRMRKRARTDLCGGDQ
jgi:hypothetical protein